MWLQINFAPMKTVNQLIIDYLDKKDMRQAQLARMMIWIYRNWSSCKKIIPSLRLWMAKTQKAPLGPYAFLPVGVRPLLRLTRYQQRCLRLLLIPLHLIQGLQFRSLLSDRFRFELSYFYFKVKNVVPKFLFANFSFVIAGSVFTLKSIYTN